MKNTICFLSLFFCLGLFAQNQRDENGKKDGKWVIKGKDRPKSGYASDAIIEEGTYSHGRKTGVWIKYNKDGVTIKLKGTYVNNRPKGNYTRYFTNGKVKEKGSFGDNNYNGTLTRYHSNGNVAYQATFDESGKETGTVKHYYENGKLEAEYGLKNGKVEGIYTQYNEEGTVRFSYKFSKGKVAETIKTNPPKKKETYTDPDTNEPPPVVSNPITKGVTFFSEGYNKVYNENDELWLDGNFKSGQLYDGKVYIYNEDGILKKIKIFKEGKFHSLGQL